MQSVRCLVSGRVQGVFFRASTQKQAQQLGLFGHVRNLPDGRVEVIARGAAADIKKLQHWLAQGPPLAQVTAVRCEACEAPAATDFQII